jgi:3-phenylpropionate/trans-cinnamate dioxygenase ferredoxin reductase subunit
MLRSFVIVGAGECGIRAAHALRERGFDGSVSLVGSEPHLPYERPPLSKGVMTSEATPAARTISEHAALEAVQIDCLVGNPAVRIDRSSRRVELKDGRRLPYDRLLLATGAEPRRLPLAGVSESRVLYLRSFEDALAIRAHLEPGKHIAIIGGGFIGLELAASARQRGAAVTVVEAQPRILMRGVPEEIADDVAAKHRSEGVELACGDAIVGTEETGSGVTLSLSSGRKVEADIVVAGIGAVPVTALAEEAGLAIDNGIAVDQTLATSDPDIFAAGDCCSFPLGLYGGRRVRLEAWRNAIDQANLAAANMLGANEPISSVPWFWSDQYDLTLQVAGIVDGAGKTVRRDLCNGAFILFHLDGGGCLVAASGIGAGNAVAKDIRLAEMLIARQARPCPSELARPDLRLKTLLAA